MRHGFDDLWYYYQSDNGLSVKMYRATGDIFVASVLRDWIYTLPKANYKPFIATSLEQFVDIMNLFLKRVECMKPTLNKPWDADVIDQLDLAIWEYGQKGTLT